MREEYTRDNYPSFGKKYAGEKAIISLTSWKARIDTVSKTLYSLLKQCPGFHIVLVLSEEEFPMMMDEMPQNLKLFVKNNLIEVLWVYKNYKSFKKVLFTMDKYRNVPVISADDDCIYKCNYAEKLYQKWTKDKKAFISPYVVKRFDVPHTGGPATLYPPYAFGDEGLKVLFNTKIWSVTNQDDDFYTGLRKKLSLKNAIRVGVWSEFYRFHDEKTPLHNEIKHLNREKRDELFNKILDSVLSA